MYERFLTLLVVLIGLLMFQGNVKQAFAEMNETLTLTNPDAPEAIAPSKQNQMLPESLEILANATGIDCAAIGIAAQPGRYYLAYQEAKSMGVELYPQLVRLQSNATPAGQLYLAALIRELDQNQGTELIKALTTNETEISQTSGCIVFKTTVGAVAAQLLDDKMMFTF